MKIELSTYENLKRMLESRDEENLVVAMGCIEQMDFRENLTYILFLLKASNVEPRQWEVYAPETTKKFINVFKVDLASSSLSFASILQLMKLYDVSQEDWQFYADRYAEHLMEKINKGAEEPLISELIITIKSKYHEIRATSEDLQRLDA